MAEDIRIFVDTARVRRNLPRKRTISVRSHAELALSLAAIAGLVLFLM